MYDIHCHILPYIDDGAKDIDDSIKMCHILSDAGIKAVIATPHFMEGSSETEVSAINERINSVSQELIKENINLTILPGMEVHIAPNLVRLYEMGKVITLNSKNHILIELPFFRKLPSYLEDVIFNFGVKRIHPVIAHPERCREIQDQPNHVYNLIDRGCIIQVNSASIKGTLGRKAQRTANLLLEHNMVHVIASDSHSSRGKMHNLDESYRIVSKGYGAEYAKKLYYENPEDIINGKEIAIPEPQKIKKMLFFYV